MLECPWPKAMFSVNIFLLGVLSLKLFYVCNHQTFATIQQWNATAFFQRVSSLLQCYCFHPLWLAGVNRFHFLQPSWAVVGARPPWKARHRQTWRLTRYRTQPCFNGRENRHIAQTKKNVDRTHLNIATIKTAFIIGFFEPLLSTFDPLPPKRRPTPHAHCHPCNLFWQRPQQNGSYKWPIAILAQGLKGFGRRDALGRSSFERFRMSHVRATLAGKSFEAVVQGEFVVVGVATWPEAGGKLLTPTLWCSSRVRDPEGLNRRLLHAGIISMQGSSQCNRTATPGLLPLLAYTLIDCFRTAMQRACRYCRSTW